ncbi:MAG: hypothetical protein HDS53_00680 [Barnesiella sp.]|nr:hypothetical protein [Barnesiella sp.]
MEEYADLQMDMRLINLHEVASQTRMYRWEFLRYDGSDVDVELSTRLNRDPKRGTIRLRLGAHYTTYRSQIRRRLLDYVIDAEYEIHDVRGVIEASPTELVITPGLMRLMLSISIGALRGMIALRTNHTFLKHFPLPVYDLDELISTIDAAGYELAYNPEAY